MQNRFYNDFDQGYLDGTGPNVHPDHRGPFAVDRDRLVFSYALRRLQSKTQVFQSGVFDYYHTRLTHSMEVARIGCSICEYLLRQKDSPLTEDFYIDRDLVEAICLGHDLGHPSFGHVGERKLNSLMGDYGGFEGNAQTVRILTDLIYKEGRSGMRPTRAFLDGVMKYKALHGECVAQMSKLPENHFIYNEQAALRNFVLGDAFVLPEDVATLNATKSIECQIMDWADDTAYSLHDILDGFRMGFLTSEVLMRWKDAHPDLDADQLAYLDQLIESTLKGNLEARLSNKIGQFVAACTLEAQEHDMAKHTQRYAWKLVIDEAAKRECAIYKRLALDLIFKSTQIQQWEFKGGNMLGKLFHALMDHYVNDTKQSLHLLPEDAHRLVEEAGSEAQKARRICDFLANMTDVAAPRMYKRLFDPDTGFLEMLY